MSSCSVHKQLRIWLQPASPNLSPSLILSFVVIHKLSLIYTNEDKLFQGKAQTEMMTSSESEVNQEMEEAIYSSNIKSC